MDSKDDLPYSPFCIECQRPVSIILIELSFSVFRQALGDGDAKKSPDTTESLTCYIHKPTLP